MFAQDGKTALELAATEEIRRALQFLPVLSRLQGEVQEFLAFAARVRSRQDLARRSEVLQAQFQAASDVKDISLIAALKRQLKAVADEGAALASTEYSDAYASKAEAMSDQRARLDAELVQLCGALMEAGDTEDCAACLDEVGKLQAALRVLDQAAGSVGTHSIILCDIALCNYVSIELYYCFCSLN